MKGSKWGYNVRIQNRSGENLENLTVKYLVAVRTTVSDSAKSGKDRTTESFIVKEGVTTVQQIENSRAATISTVWIDCTETKWEEQRIIYKRDAEGDSYTEEILAKLKEDLEVDGIRIKVFLGDREIAEWESQGKTIKEAAWKNQGAVGQANGGAAAPMILVPIGANGRVTSAEPVLYHKDLDPVPAKLEKFKGDKALSQLWFAFIRLGREYASASENRKPSGERRKLKEEYDETLKEFVAANQWVLTDWGE